MKKYLLKSIILLVFGLLLIHCEGGPAVIAQSDHPSDFLLTHGEHIGPYQSLGSVTVGSNGPAFGCITGLGSNDAQFVEPFLMSDKQKRLKKELIEDQLIQQAKALGANAIIKYKYNISEIGYCLPLFGPLNQRTMTASGEAVQIRNYKK